MTRLSHKFNSSIKYPQAKALCKILWNAPDILKHIYLQTQLCFRKSLDFHVRLYAESTKNRPILYAQFIYR